MDSVKREVEAGDMAASEEISQVIGAAREDHQVNKAVGAEEQRDGSLVAAAERLGEGSLSQWLEGIDSEIGTLISWRHSRCYINSHSSSLPLLSTIVYCS